MMKTILNQVLEKSRSGQSTQWNNPETGRVGAIVPTGTLVENGILTCPP